MVSFATRGSEDAIKRRDWEKTAGRISSVAKTSALSLLDQTKMGDHGGVAEDQRNVSGLVRERANPATLNACCVKPVWNVDFEGRVTKMVIVNTPNLLRARKWEGES